MEEAPVVWLEDQGSHSSHLTKAPTLHSSVKEEGGEKAAGKKITESAGRFIAFKPAHGITVGDEAEGADAGLATIYPGEPVRVP